MAGVFRDHWAPSYGDLRKHGRDRYQCICTAKTTMQRCRNYPNFGNKQAAIGELVNLPGLKSRDRLDVFEEIALQSLCWVHKPKRELIKDIAREWDYEYKQSEPQPETRSTRTRTSTKSSRDTELDTVSRFADEPERVVHISGYRLRQSARLNHSTASASSTISTPTSTFKPLTASLPTFAEALTGPLSDRDQPGFIYAFQRPNSPSYIKIGLTTRTTAARGAEIERDCNYSPVFLNQVTTYMPYCYRGEKLVHALLKDQRRIEWPCNDGNGCHRHHKEFFKTNERIVRKAVIAVQKLLKADIYEQLSADAPRAHRLDEPPKVLKAAWREHLKDLADKPSVDELSEWIDAFEDPSDSSDSESDSDSNSSESRPSSSKLRPSSSSRNDDNYDYNKWPLDRFDRLLAQIKTESLAKELKKMRLSTADILKMMEKALNNVED